PSATKSMLRPAALRLAAANRTPIAELSSCGEFFAELSTCVVPEVTSSVFGVDNSIVVGARPIVDVEMGGAEQGEAAVAASATIVGSLDRVVTRCFVIFNRHATNALSPSALQRLSRPASQRR